MTRAENTNLDATSQLDCQLVMMDICKNNKGKLVCADTFREAALKAGILPKFIARHSGFMFRVFRGSGYLRPTNTTVISKYNNSARVPVYEVT